MGTASATLYCRSSESMPEIPSNSIQLVLTSPPYFPVDAEPFLYGGNRTGMTAGEAFERISSFAGTTLQANLKECARVLAPGGHLVLQTRDVRIGSCLVPVEPLHRSFAEACGLELVCRHFWRSASEKGSRLGIRDALARKYGPLPINPEVFLVFVKPGAEPRLGEPESEDLELLSADFMRTQAGTLPARHRFQSPLKVVRAFIRTYTREGDTVLDPFAGGGSVAHEAVQLGRNAVLWEIDPQSVSLIKQNVEVKEAK